MKFNLPLSTLAKYTGALLSALLTFSVSTVTFAAEETFTLDPNHTYILWHVSHFGFSNLSGKWLANGTVVLDKEHPDKSKVNVTIKVADLITAIPELDKHLSGKLFFNVVEFPVAKFTSNKVMLTGADTVNVEGTLTVRGVSKPITLNMKLNKAGINPINNKMSVGFSGSTQLKRSDFGINALLPGVGDDVAIEIEAEGAKVG